MKQFISALFAVVFIFFVSYDGNSQSTGNRAVSTIAWMQDGAGFIQYSTNDPENLRSGWWKFTDNILGNIYQIECKKISGALDHGFGLVFGASNTDNQKFYVLLISADGCYYIFKEDGKKRTIIKDWTISERIKTGYNVTNTLKVVKNGTEFTVFLNGGQVYQFKDSSIKGDRLGYWVTVGDQNEESFPNRPVDVRYRQPINETILGDRYIEKKTGFSMFIPKDWKLFDRKEKYLYAMGSAENNSSPNIVFVDERYSGFIQEYINALTSHLQQAYPGIRVINNGMFELLQGMQGGYLTIQGIIEEVNVRQRYYIIPNQKGDMVVVTICTTSPASGNRYDAIFDECVKTFIWTK